MRKSFIPIPIAKGYFSPCPESFQDNYDKHLTAVRDALLTCKLFTITPGLNECWQFTGDGTFFSRNPRGWAAQVMARPRVLTVQENIDYLQRFIDIVRHHNPEITFVISLSPIPFLATWRAHDTHVVQARQPFQSGPEGGG